MRWIYLGFCLLIAPSFALADDAADAGAKLYEYFAIFNEKDAQKVANTIYSTPVHIGGGSGHRILSDPESAP